MAFVYLRTTCRLSTYTRSANWPSSDNSSTKRLSGKELSSISGVAIKADDRQTGVMEVDGVRLQMRIAKVIRRHREGTKLSQEAFADHIGMHRAQYSFVERGKRDIRLSTLERVARGLEMPIWTILREAEQG